LKTVDSLLMGAIKQLDLKHEKHLKEYH